MTRKPPYAVEYLLWDQDTIRQAGDTSPDIWWTRTYFPPSRWQRVKRFVASIMGRIAA